MPKKESKKYPMPTWIWRLRPKIINNHHKIFLNFIWSCTNTGCRSWNYYLAKMFNRKPRTIQLWIKHLKALDLVNVNFPRTRHRTIYRMPFFNIVDYYKYRAKMTTTIELPKPKTPPTNPAQQIAHINTPQEKNKLKSAYSSPHCGIAETPAAGADPSIASNAGGLGGSGDAKKPELEK